MTRTKVHELKIFPQYFEDIYKGYKTFELRKYDRDYDIGDTLKLCEYKDGEYTSRYLTKEITDVFFGGEYGLSEEYVILSLTYDIFDSYGIEKRYLEN